MLYKVIWVSLNKRPPLLPLLLLLV